MRRILTIVAIVIVVLGLAAGGYFYYAANRGAELTVGGSAVENPFGDTGTSGSASGGFDGTDTTGDNNAEEPAVTQVAPRLVRIGDRPTAQGLSMLRVTVPGVAVPATGTTTSSTTPLATATTTDTEIRYIERESGNVYAYRVHAPSVTRLSNRTVPGVSQASWLPDGSVAFVRSISTEADGTLHAQAYALPANGVGGYALPRDLAQAFAVGSTSVFTLSVAGNGSTGTLANADGGNTRTAFTSPLGQITAFTTRAGLFAETNPSAARPGYAFSIDASGAFTRIVGPLPGLSILPNRAGTKVLVSYLDGKALRLAALDLSTHSLTTLPVATLTEKCVWAPDDSSAYCAVPIAIPAGTLPDDWYQGAVSFSDRLWKIDFDARVAELVTNLPSLSNTEIDAVSLTLDPAEDAIGFIGKRDGSLWVYDL